MNDEQALIDSFRSIELKHSGLGAANADRAEARIRGRFQDSVLAPDIQEFQFNLKHDWQTFVFHALLKRYGIRPYRYRKQRKSTILIRVSKQIMDDLLWPIFNDVAGGFAARINQMTMALVPAIAPGPYSLAVLDHKHGAGELCESCRKRLLEQA